MEGITTGIVDAVHKLWFLKINTKHARATPADGAVFPHLVTVRYSVDGREYRRRKYLNAFKRCPCVGEAVSVVYDLERPAKCIIQR